MHWSFPTGVGWMSETSDIPERLATTVKMSRCTETSDSNWSFQSSSGHADKGKLSMWLLN